MVEGAEKAPAPVRHQDFSNKEILMGTVVALLSDLDSISIDECIVVGNYTRFDPVVRNLLRKQAKRIRDACSNNFGGYHNFLIWGSSGEGKTYFATESANGVGIKWDKINLARAADVPDEATYKKRLAAVRAKDRPFLFIIDECDKRPEPWVCAALFDYLSFEPNENAKERQDVGRKARDRGNSISKKSAPTGNKVFVLIGSTGDSVSRSGLE